LQCAESASANRQQVSLGDAEALAGLLLGFGQFLRRKLWDKKRSTVAAIEIRIGGRGNCVRARWFTAGAFQGCWRGWKLQPEIGSQILRERRNGDVAGQDGSNLNRGGPRKCARPFFRAARENQDREAEYADDPPKSILNETRSWLVVGPGHVQAASGSSMRKVVPRPTSEIKSIEPLWS